MAGTASGQLIDDVGVIPDPFSPNDDGVFDETALYYSLSELAIVTITVAGQSGWGPDTLMQGQVSPGSQSLWWDGRSGGETVPDGVCYFVINAQPQWAPPDEIEIPFTVDTEPPSAGQYMVSPSRFSPDGDGVADSLLVTLFIESPEPTDEIHVKVTTTEGSAVRDLYSATGATEASFFWDGSDADGTPAGDGLYQVRFGIRDAAGNETVSIELVDVDTEPPILAGDFPDPEIPEFRFAVESGEVTGSAVDRGGVVAVEFAVDQGAWQPAEIVRADSVSWTASVACDTCVIGAVDEYAEVQVRAFDGTPTADGHGHVNTEATANPILVFDVIFDVAPPIHESSSLVAGDGPYEPGQQISVSSRWDETGYEVDGDFSAIDPLFDQDDVEVTEQSGGRYTVSYTLPADLAVPDGARPIVITATDRFLTPGGEVERSVSDTTVYVTVVPASGELSGLAVDVNSFNPLMGEAVTIGFGSAQAGARVTIFNMRGTLVRTLEGEGVSSLAWDGTNDEGDLAASGVYFLRIQTDDGEAERNVAIVK
jgi:flagellar hook assembly protein FlgD